MRFSRNCRVSCTCFFLPFPNFPLWLDHAHSGKAWKSLFPLHTSDVIDIKTDDVTSDTRDMDLHGWIWVVQWRVDEYGNTPRFFRLQAPPSFLRVTGRKPKSRLMWMKDARMQREMVVQRVKKMHCSYFQQYKTVMSIFLDFSPFEIGVICYIL